MDPPMRDPFPSLVVALAATAVGPASAGLYPADIVSYAIRSADTGQIFETGFDVGSDAERLAVTSPAETPWSGTARGGGVKTRSNVRNNRSAPGADVNAWFSSNVAAAWTLEVDDLTLTGGLPASGVTPSARPFAELDAASRSAVTAWATSGGASLELNLATNLGLEVRVGLRNASSGDISFLGSVQAGSTGISLTGLKPLEAGWDLVLVTDAIFGSLNFSHTGGTDMQVRYAEVTLQTYMLPAPGSAALIGLAGLITQRRRN